MRQTDEARRQIEALKDHYRRKQRPEAIRNLVLALRSVDRLLADGQDLPFPRPYPHAERTGVRWVKAHRYWIGVTDAHPRVVVAVHCDAVPPGSLQD